MKNQRTDGDVNHDFDCVPTCIAAGMEYLLKQLIDDAKMKDAVYGAGYVGGTAASAYVDYCAQRGVKLFAVENGSPALAVSQAHGTLAKGLPVIFTQQDDYSSNPDFTHVCVWYKDSGASLTAMDPFGGFALTYSDEVWAKRLRSNELWIMEKIMVPANWKDDGTTLTAPNGIPVKLGFREYVLNNHWDPNNVPLEAEVGIDPIEEGFSQTPSGGSRQIFNGCELGYTVKRGVYMIGVGNELRFVRADRNKAKGMIATLQQQLQDAKTQIIVLQALPSMTNLQQITLLAGQIAKLSQVQ